MSETSTSSVDGGELKKKLSEVSSSSQDMAKRRIQRESNSNIDVKKTRRSSSESSTNISDKRMSRSSSKSYGSDQKFRDSNDNIGSSKIARKTSGESTESEESKVREELESYSYTPLEQLEQSGERVAKYLVSDLLVDVCEKEEEWQQTLETPNLALDKIRSIAFLKKPSPKEGVSLFDHLSELLRKVLAEKPTNVIEYFEEYSRNLKEERFHPATDHLQDVYISPDEIVEANKMLKLIRDINEHEDKDATVEEEDELSTFNAQMMEVFFFFEQIGVTLPRNEVYLIALSIRKLQQSQHFEKIRFWGKILGTKQDYFIAETELPEEEYERQKREEEEQAREHESTPEEETQPEPESMKLPERITEEAEEDREEIGNGDARSKHKPLPPIPKSTYKLPPEVPSELSGEGVNKKIYFVCNSPGDEWIMLPNVTPKQINVARKIKRYFTGNLETEIITYPTFPGNEISYLRAQIARISAGTQVSPLGFYHFSEDEEEEVEEEEGIQINPVENPDYDPVPMKDLLDPTVSFWVHHTMPILKQGRTSWWNPRKKSDEEAEEEEVEEEEEEEGREEPEIGPQLLTPLSEDATLESIPPWTVCQSSFLIPDFAIGAVRSNLWPGAYAYAAGRKFDNIYIGWGHKFTTHNYSPPPLEAIQSEYPMGPEIMEIADPTPDEEETWRLAHEKKKPSPIEEGEDEEIGEEVEEEEEEEEEEDD